MPLQRLNIVGGRISCPQTGEEDLPALIASQLRKLGGNDPIVILLHGYRYSPHCRYRDAHDLIFSERHRTDGPRRFGISWPSALGFGPGAESPGLCLPISWDARGSLRDVYERAEDVGRVLAGLLGLIAALDPHRPVHLMAHSLGARVALAAVTEVRVPVLRRLILLAPAEFEAQARQALVSRGGASMEVLQVSPAENRVFDLLLSQGLRERRPAGATLGRVKIAAPNWVHLGIDTEDDLKTLSRRGFPVGPRTSRICHWSAYLRPGLMSLYSACLSGAGTESLAYFARGAARREKQRSQLTLAVTPLSGQFARTARREAQNVRTNRSLLLAHPEWLEGVYRARRI